MARGLDTEVQYLKGIGPKLATLLDKVGLRTVRDVLYYLPRRYEDRTNMPEFSSVRPGQWVTIRGRLYDLEARATRNGTVILKALLTDGRSTIALVWFNQPWLKRKLEGYRGDVIAYGQIKEGNLIYEISSPEFELIDEDEEGEDFARIVPVYPLVEGLPQRVVRKAVESAVQNFLPGIEETLPVGLLRKYEFPPLEWSLKQIHQPESDASRIRARERLAFEEFFFLQLGLAIRRSKTQQEHGIAFPIGEIKPQLNAEIPEIFPFTLTAAQLRVIDEIWRDMERESPMNRLVQGDVGSGKTAVAICAMLAAIKTGFQAALMAPTEILAEQHFHNLSRILTPLGIEVTLLVGKQGVREKQKAYDAISVGKTQIAVGTHAMIQEGVQFKKLGFVVIDEQHRFGVLQRAALREKGLGNPDVLVMTATPIPRTLTMALFGDLDVSIIDELPPGRKPIKTHWKTIGERQWVYDTVKQMVEEGRQVYIVCPMVGESEKMLAQAAEELFNRLSSGPFSHLRLGLLHGQMKSKDKESAMEQFRKHEVDILVATTVIEVGVDVPNATLMVVEDANRFGLSQLHQLRGRVGRGHEQSFCVLIADAKNEEAKARMETMAETTDGFKIAEVDLRLRGPGELVGTRQHGNLDFKIADLVQDSKMMELAREAALILANSDPTFERPQNQKLVEMATKKTDGRGQAVMA